MGGKGPPLAAPTRARHALQDLNGQPAKRNFRRRQTAVWVLCYRIWNRGVALCCGCQSAAKKTSGAKEVLIDWQNVNKGLLQTDPDEDKCKKKTDFLRQV